MTLLVYLLLAFAAAVLALIAYGVTCDLLRWLAPHLERWVRDRRWERDTRECEQRLRSPCPRGGQIHQPSALRDGGAPRQKPPRRVTGRRRDPREASS